MRDLAHGLLFGIGGHAQFLGTEGVAAFHAPGSHEGSSEIRVVKAVDAHTRPAAGAVDELPVPHIDAGMVAAAGMVEGHDVTGAHVFHTGDALAYGRLLPGRARQVDAHALVGPLDEAGAVEAAGIAPAGHIGGTDGGTGHLHGLGLPGTALLDAFIENGFIGAAETGFLRRALALRVPGFFGITGRAGPGMGGATGAQGQQAHGKGYQQSWDKTHAFSGVRNRNQKEGKGPGGRDGARMPPAEGQSLQGDRTTAGRPALPQGHTKLGRECISTGCCQV